LRIGHTKVYHPKGALKDQIEYAEVLSLVVQLHPLLPRRGCHVSATLSLRVPVRCPTRIDLDLPLTPLISIVGKRRKILTCTQETTKAKLERLCLARLIHRDQTITTRHAKALIKNNELISLLAPTLSTITHIICQVMLINIKRFTSYSKHAKVSKQY
jgi:hypothetical protein